MTPSESANYFNLSLFNWSKANLYRHTLNVFRVAEPVFKIFDFSNILSPHTFIIKRDIHLKFSGLKNSVKTKNKSTSQPLQVSQSKEKISFLYSTMKVIYVLTCHGNLLQSTLSFKWKPTGMKLTPTDQSSENSITIPKRFHYEENRSILMSLRFPDKYRSFDATLFHFGFFICWQSKLYNNFILL